MNIPCIVPCQTCVPPGGFVGGGSNPADPDYPFINLSSEDPDVDNFIGKKFGPPPGDPGGGPPLGNYFYAIGCLGWCVSAVSQAEADLCAARQEIECLGTNWPPPPPGNPPPPQPPINPPPTFPPMPIYQNTEQSCDFTCPDGNVFTYTVPAGTFYAFSQAAANVSAKSYACQNAIARRLCVGSLTPTLSCTSLPYSGSITASASMLPVVFAVVGDLPEGLFGAQSIINPLTFNLNGTVTTPGDYDFAIRVTDSVGSTMVKPVTLTFFGIVNDSTLAEATEGSAYLVNLITGGTVTGNVTFALTGVLPAGLTLNTATGAISGTPDTGSNGEYNFVVTASADGLSCSKEFFMTVAEPVSCPDWTQLLWGVPGVVTIDAGTASFTPNSATSDTWSGESDGTPTAPFFGDLGLVSNSGTITYNGPGCNCICHVNALSVSPGGTAADWTIVVSSAMFGVLLSENRGTLGNGTFDLPFSLPDTVGSDDTITVTAYCASNCNGVNAVCSSDLSGFVANA